MIPGLAESWKGSDDGKTWTYTLREGLKWSDGTPLTAEDVAYTINRSREEEWLNHDSTVQNLEASAPSTTHRRDRALVGAGPEAADDGRLHRPEAHLRAGLGQGRSPKYHATTASARARSPSTKWVKGQYVRLKANPSYCKGKPAIDEVVLRLVHEPRRDGGGAREGRDRRGHNVPSTAFKSLAGEKGIVAIQGQQGGFDELAMNGGAG